MEEDIDPFLEDDHVKQILNNEVEHQDPDKEASILRSSPVFQSQSFGTKHCNAQRKRNPRKSGLSSVPGISPTLSKTLQHFEEPPSLPPESHVIIPSTTLASELDQSISTSHYGFGSNSEDDMFASQPSTALSEQIIPSAINDLLSGLQPADVSWTSSMATPLASNVTWSNLNTEERKVLLPSEDCKLTVKPRALFSPGFNDSTDCQSLNISSDTEYLQALRGEKFEKTPKLNGRNLTFPKRSIESPLAAIVDQGGTPRRKYNESCDQHSKGSPILSGSSEFRRTPHESELAIQEDEDLFENIDGAPMGLVSESEMNSKKDCSIAESTPNAGIKRRSPSKEKVQDSTPSKYELSNAESFLQDISVTALEEVCHAQEMKETCIPSISTPEKQSDTKGKRSLFSINPVAANHIKAVFKAPAVKPEKKDKSCIQENLSNDCIPDDSFMEHLAAMNNSIFSDVFQPVTKVQSIKASESQMKKFCYEVVKETPTYLDKPSLKNDSQKLMKEILTPIVALESTSHMTLTTKTNILEASGGLVVFSQLQGEVNEPAEENFGENCISASAGQNHESVKSSTVVFKSISSEFLHTNVAPSSSEGFQTASGNRIELSQEAINNGLKILKGAIEDISETSEIMKCVSSVQSSEIKQKDSNLPNFSEDQMVQAEEEVKQLLKLVSDGEDFNPWHEVEQTICPETEKVQESQQGQAFSGYTPNHQISSKQIVGGASSVSTRSTSPTSGFSTASGRNIFISEEQLAHARKLLSDSDDKLIDICHENSEFEENPTKHTSVSRGKGEETDDSTTVCTKVERKRQSMEEDQHDNFEIPKKKTCFGNTSIKNINRNKGSSKIDLWRRGEEITQKEKICMNVSEEALTVMNNLLGNSPSAAPLKEKYSSLSSESRTRANCIATSGKTSNTYPVALSTDPKTKVEEGAQKSCNHNATLTAVHDGEGGKQNNAEFEEVLENSSLAACFKTASGRDVHVSKQSLNKVQNLFDDLSDESVNQVIDNNSMKTKTIEPEGENISGFATASGRRLTVSEKSLGKASKLFHDISDDLLVEPETKLSSSFLKEGSRSPAIKINSIMEKEMQSVTIKITTEEEAFGFSTASGQKVSVSKQAMKKAHNLFDDLPESMALSADELKTIHSKSGPLTSMKCDTERDCFSTASGKLVTVSKQSLNGVKDLFDNSSDIIAPNTDAKAESPTKRGFFTASGKSVQVSEQSLNKVKGLFDLLPDLAFPNAEVDTKSPKKMGFSTASGKEVNISKEALEKARNIFEELPCVVDTESTLPVDVNKHSNSWSPEYVPQQKGNTRSMMQGFSTAGGKAVSISKEALSKVKTLFDPDDVSSQSVLELFCNGKSSVSTSQKNEAETAVNSVGMTGFSTAGGKSVQISKEALQKAKSIFDDVPVESLNLPKESDTSVICVNKVPGKHQARSEDSSKFLIDMVGFSTAGGRAVQISEEALRKAKNVFEDLPAEYTDSNNSCGKTNLSNMAAPDDSGVFLSYDSSMHQSSLSKPVKSIERPRHLSCSASFFAEKENKTLSLRCGQKIPDLNEISKSSLTQEITASTAAFLADDESFDGTETLNASNSKKTIKTSPSLVTDRSSNLKPILTKASGNKCQVSEPTSPILVKSDNAASRRRTRKGRLSLSSITSTKPPSPTLGSQSSSSQTWNRKSRLSLPSKDSPSKMSSHGKIHSTDKERSAFSCLSNHSSSFISTSNNSSDVSMKLPPSRKLFAHESMSSASELDTPNAKSIGIAPLSAESNGTPLSSSNSRDSLAARSSHQSSLVRKALTRNITTPSSGFKTPFKSSHQDQLKRSPSSPALNPPEAKRMKSSPNLYVSHISFSPSDSCGIRTLRPEVAEMRRRAAEEQKQLVENYSELKGELLKPCIGSWYCRRQSGDNTELMKLSQVARPKNFTPNELRKIGLRALTMSVTSNNSAAFRFSAWDFYSEDVCRENVAGLPVGDGALLVLDSQGTAGAEEFERAFLASPGVDPSLIPSGWLKNHYRWIVWKLAAMEWRYPHEFARRCLSPHNLMLQLKYRYDREIDKCQRPALRRILEHDDSAAKRMVLCVASIITKDPNQGIVELELTDGWYSVTATIDPDMQQRVKRGIIRVGTKLIMHGAELVNCSEGCFPLQAQPDIRLKLCSNSSRRARWYAKLGFQDNPGPIKISLGSILSSGGAVSCFTAHVARVYPVVFMEKSEQRTVFRSQRAESKEVAKQERKRQQFAEVVYSQVQSEIQREQTKRKQPSLKYSIKNLSNLTSGEDLCEILENTSDPHSVQSMLTEEQKRIISDHQRYKQEELRREMEARVRSRLAENNERHVTPILKVRLHDYDNKRQSCSAILSVWRPSEDLSSVFKEGQKLSIFGAAASGSRFGELQLSANRSTRYHSDETSMVKAELLRSVFPLSSLTSHGTVPLFGELDIVGLVIRVSAAPQTSANMQVQTAYITDAQQNIVGVTFWEGIKELGVEDLVTPCSFIAATNLQWRGGQVVRNVPCVYASEFSFFSTNPRQGYLQNAMQNLRRTLSTDIKTFCKASEEKLDSVLLQKASSPDGCSKTPSIGSCLSKATEQSLSSCASHHGTPNCSSGDFLGAQQRFAMDQELQNPSNNGFSPHVEKRLAKLDKYGEPPPISPIIICQPRRSLRKDFKAPRRMDSPLIDCKKKSTPQSAQK